jgi:hypothetical protein
MMSLLFVAECLIAPDTMDLGKTAAVSQKSGYVLLTLDDRAVRLQVMAPDDCYC